jgi:hypothetical protein
VNATGPALDAPATLRYTLFDTALTSEHEFENRLAPARPGAREGLSFRYVATDPLEPGWDEAPAAYRSPLSVDGDHGFLDIFELDAVTVLRFGGVASFFVTADRIVCRLLDPEYAFMVELHFLGFVMAYWLEMRGHPAMHAAAVVHDDVAIGFLSSNKGGKTSLAATFLRRGHALLSDDIVALDVADDAVWARPSYPQMRMWPEQVAHFFGDVELELVHPRMEKRRVPLGDGFGAFCEQRMPLACLYVPERADVDEPVVATLGPAQAVFALARYAFLDELLPHLRLQRNRLTLTASIARRVPVRRLVYPDGLEHLDRVADFIREDVTTLGRAARGG